MNTFGVPEGCLYVGEVRNESVVVLSDLAGSWLVGLRRSRAELSLLSILWFVKHFCLILSLGYVQTLNFFFILSIDL